MKRIFYLTVIILFVMFFNGCENHLDVPPVSDITSASFWRNESDAQAYLNGIYSSYREHTNTDSYSEERADLLKKGEQGAAVSRSFTHTLTADSDGRDWRSYYTTIHHCNLLLYKLEELDLNYPNIKAQALLFRAMIYFKLIKIFGDVPLKLEPTLMLPDEGFERTQLGVVMEQIKVDVNNAINLFVTNEISTNRNFLSKPAALAFKADVFMWSGRFLGEGDVDINEAIQAINTIESTGGNIGLLDNYSDIFDINNENNKEIIFAVNYDINETGATFYRLYNVRQDYLGGVSTIAIEFPDVPHSGNAGLNGMVFSDKMADYYLENDDDARYAHNLYYIRRKSDDLLITTMITKFLGSWDGVNRNFVNDIIEYRWADMLLLRAEAYNSLSSGRNVAKALSDLNRVRNRAKIGDYTGPTDKVTLEDEILKERAKELCYENKRWEDLIRAGKVPENVQKFQDSRGTDLRYIYWPISRDIMALNPLLVQTPGYEDL